MERGDLSREQSYAILRQRIQRNRDRAAQVRGARGPAEPGARPWEQFGLGLPVAGAPAVPAAAVGAPGDRPAAAPPAENGGGRGAVGANGIPNLPPQVLPMFPGGLPQIADGPGQQERLAYQMQLMAGAMNPIGPRFQGALRVPMGMGMGYVHNLFRQAPIAKEEDAPRTKNLQIQGSIVSFKADNDQIDAPGVYVSGKPFSVESNYFEVEVAAKIASHLTLSIGLVSRTFSLENLPGRSNDTFAFSPGDGLLFRGSEVGSPFGPRAMWLGDKIGCGIKFSPVQSQGKNAFPAGVGAGQLFFTRNSKEIGSIPIHIPPGGFFPAISMTAAGESVVLRTGLRFIQEEEIMMMVDNCDDDWLNLHDIRLNGPVLEYSGRGKSLVDVGLAQAKHPISTRHHYFEIEIIDPGLRCYIAIGLARKDYPKNRHPGWNRGSIAYHADDGKVFVGSGVGAPFGPRCHKGDIMGCGVLFPRNYEYRSDSDDELEPIGGPNEADPFQAPGVELGGNGGAAHNFPQFDYPSDSADDEDWWNDRNYLPHGVKVQIYFTRNGNVIGKREVRIPKGGFFPTVGMMSSEEKVRVDLRPLSG